jgi:hypothetical protein
VTRKPSAVMAAQCPMADKLPRLFFEHFTDTSFVAERDGKLAVSWPGSSPSPGLARPTFTFPAWIRQSAAAGSGACSMRRSSRLPGACGRDLVRAVTSLVNRGSVYQRMVFQLEPGDAEVDGIPVSSGYDGHSGGRVRFIRSLRGASPTPHSSTPRR